MHQLSLFNFPPEGCWTGTDDWETPSHLAQQIVANLIRPSDRRILEPAAGTGQFAQFLPSSDCIEINPSRVSIGKQKAAHCCWARGNFLELTPPSKTTEKYDLVVGNPPFSKGLEFIEHCLHFLNSANPIARILFLLPQDYFNAKHRARVFSGFDCQIYQTHRIVGRVAYIGENGCPVKGRQSYDAVFDIRPGQPKIYFTLTA